nr:MAG TPA: hypothetical protein [Caudoviricetes sp.]
MTLADVRDYIASLNLTKEVYMGKLPDKPEQSIGVYNSKHQYPPHRTLGGPDWQGYGIKHVTLLVHWNKSPRETEKAATALFDAMNAARDAKINETTIKFIQLLYDLQDIGTDETGVCEYVIEAAVIYEKEVKK